MNEEKQKKYMQKRYDEDMNELAKMEKEIVELEKRLEYLKRTAQSEKNTLNKLKEKYNLK